MNEKYLKNSLSLVNDFHRMATPIFEMIPIDHLSLRRFYVDGKFFYIATYQKWLEYYISNNYYKLPDFEKHFTKDKCSKFSLWDHWDREDKFFWKVIGNLAQNFNQGHGLTIIKLTSEYCDVYNMSVSCDKSYINNVYLNFLDNIDAFLTCFQVKVSPILRPLITDSYFRPLKSNLLIQSKKIISNADQKETNFLSHLNLSKREIQCLELLCKGMTMKMIANTLTISSRTVESHLNNLKYKLDLPYKSDLIQFWNNKKGYNT